MSRLTRCIGIHVAVSVYGTVNSIMHTPRASGALMSLLSLLLLNLVSEDRSGQEWLEEGCR